MFEGVFETLRTHPYIPLVEACKVVFMLSRTWMMRGRGRIEGGRGGVELVRNEKSTCAIRSGGLAMN